MDYARGMRVEGTGIDWQALKNMGVSFVVINGSKSEKDKWVDYDVARLIQEAYDNKVPAIIETVFDVTYYKYYGSPDKWPENNEDAHVQAALKGLSHKTCYGFWIASYDSRNIPWNASALGVFTDRMRHELNKIPLRGTEFPIGIRMSQGWYNGAKNDEGISNLSWFYNKPKWAISADWSGISGVANFGKLGRDKWDFAEYENGLYVFNGTRDQLYTHIKFTPSTQPPPEDEDPEDDDPIIIDIDFTPIFIELDSMKADLAEIRSDLEYIKKHFT